MIPSRRRLERAAYDMLEAPPLARAAAKRVINDHYGVIDEMTFRTGDRSAEAQEGFAAFVEKRPPAWAVPRPEYLRGRSAGNRARRGSVQSSSVGVRVSAERRDHVQVRARVGRADQAAQVTPDPQPAPPQSAAVGGGTERAKVVRNSSLCASEPHEPTCRHRTAPSRDHRETLVVAGVC